MQEDSFDIDWQGYRCEILPGKAGPFFEKKERYNLIYCWWKNYWTNLMIGLGSSMPSLEEFYRQDYVVTILDENNIVALLCINQFNLECFAKDHPYFEKFNHEFWSFIEEKKIKQVFSGQWITVNEEYSARKTGINFAAIILGLGHKVYKNYAHEHSALVTVARRDLASANTARKFGWVNIGNPFELHNVKCEQLALIGSPKVHKDPRVNEFIEHYWMRRREHSQGYSASLGNIAENKNLKQITVEI